MKAINHRFKILYGMLGFVSADEFTAALGIHRTYLNQIYTNGLNPRFEKRLKTKFPRVNLDYLRTGEGAPLLPEPTPEVSDIQRAGQVGLVVKILEQLDDNTLGVILEGIEQYKQTSHFQPPEVPDKKK